MKKIYTTVTLLCCIILAFGQQRGKIIETSIVKSKILNKDVSYAVYLPPDYDVSERTYPVVYLLHGLSGDNTQSIQWGEINRYADKAMAEGTIHGDNILSC
jgi:enterochelin esterase-like enzyme